MEELLQSLNDEQREAVVEKEGALLVLAGAGSGKTKVLTTRIVNLVKSGVNPYKILAVTFTNKAAKEMRERLSKMIGEEVVKKMWVGTFHNICGRILRFDLENYKSTDGRKWDNNYVIYDETDSNAIIKNAIKKLNLDEKVYAPKLVKAAISNAKSKMQDAYTFSTRARDYRTQKISEIYDEYEKQLMANNAIDFDDMLLLTVNLLSTNEEVRNKYHERFSHILVDEFQDTNISQYMLIKHLYSNEKAESDLKGRSLCVVGDVDQSIYSWRGADYKIILNFQTDYRNAKLIKLEKNYRSVATILDAANAIIVNNTERVSKNLYSTKGKGEKIDIYEAQDEAGEAYYIANKIKNYARNLNDYAVLYRTNSQSRAIEEALISQGISYRMVGGLKFYDRKEIKDLIAYLKIIYNRHDSQSLKRIINVPKRAIGDTTVKKIQDIASSMDYSMYEVIQNINDYDDVNASTKTKLTNFAQLLDKLEKNKDTLSLPEFIAFIIEETGYLAELKQEDTEESQSRIENLQELVNVARDFAPDEEDNILGEFLAQVALVSDLDETPDADNAVTLMTLHAAKGLEFETVFLAGLEEGIFPHSRSLNSNIEMEEERRLMYVGVTRAKQKLYITYAKRRQMWGETKYYNPSRFLAEIPDSLTERNTSEDSSSSYSGSTFKQAVNKLKTDRSGYVEKTTSFGAGFVAPVPNQQAQSISRVVKPKPTSNYKPPQPVKKEAFIVKNAQNKAKDEEKVQKLLEDNPIKRMLEEKKQKEAALAKKSEETNTYNIGDRVFHEKFGIGHIDEIKQIGSSSMYVIDFGKQGKKAVDALYANLKKF
ncbi:MAG: exodeoxyribonuclease V subunit gamma [Clostridium sp.]|nr:exodeoxyribonuclease V subunit gamma [Clostridium sp.]